ncbi:efflux RND transporter periplasmic adaptor subunit [Thalassoroseus pseudoceratinae]|uniref:efflux RND transporter periplasmic adaptor subunit n=1 Tax=Thalassoroseus pseudoceratinae TaxID=2713176 RepID=UPI00197FC15F|nr:efflux RND transporter periplasmic adaptor subunit [Thalassoroseus pseudoceratinae]
MRPRASIRNCSCLAFPILLVVLLGITSTAMAQRTVRVILSPVQRSSIRSEQAFVGSVMPERRAVVGSAVDGRVVEFPVEEGDRVEKGGTLAQLLTETISLELTAAKAELEMRREELQELKAGSRPEEIEQARAQMEAAKAVLELAESRKSRAQTLYARNSISEDELLQAISVWSAAQETFNERKAGHVLAVAGPRKEKVAQADAMARMQEAVVQKLSDQIKKHTIISRFDGYVSAEHTEEGQWVNRGDLVAEVVALDRVDVVVNVLESHVPHLQIGGAVEIVEVPALGRSFRGEIVSINPQGDPRSRTFPVKVRVENEIVDGQPVIKAGMLARAYLPTGSQHEGLLVPKDALVLSGNQRSIFVVKPNKPSKNGEPQTGTAVAVPVETHAARGVFIEVKGDVKQDDLVVVLGNERLRPRGPNEVIIVDTVDPTKVGPSTSIRSAVTSD